VFELFKFSYKALCSFFRLLAITRVVSSRKALVPDHAAISKEVVIANSQTQPKDQWCSEYASRIKKLAVDLDYLACYRPTKAHEGAAESRGMQEPG
jgi:hypothetical protein